MRALSAACAASALLLGCGGAPPHPASTPTLGPASITPAALPTPLPVPSPCASPPPTYGGSSMLVLPDFPEPPEGDLRLRVTARDGEVIHATESIGVIIQ